MTDAKLPLPANVLIVLSFVAGLVFTGVALAGILESPRPSGSILVIFAILSILVGVTRLWPIVVYLDPESESLNLDEGLLVMAVLLLPSPYAMSTFVVSTAVVQAIRRRSPRKAVFNWGQVVASAGVGVVISRFIAVYGPAPGLANVAAAATAAVVFFALNSAWMAAIVSATGTPWVTALKEGLLVRLWFLSASVSTSAMLAMATASHSWAIGFAVVTLLILRQLIAGPFQALHDRFRLLGLFKVALAANQSLREDEVLTALLLSTRTLLRSNAEVTERRPVPGELAAEMSINGHPLSLIVSTRDRNEPFDAADLELIQALAAIGSGALRNASFYQELRRQQERLSAITGSMGEGVCALDDSAKVTFFNPAACRMLGWGNDESDLVAMDFLRLPAEDAMASSGRVRTEEAVFRRCDGTDFPVALTASALIQNDRPVGAVIVFRDISERRELEARLQASQKLEALGRLAGGVAHDFNNVLAAISLCGDLLNQAVSGKALDYVSEICASAARATGLTEQLLTFSRSQRVFGGSSDPAEVMISMQQMLRRLIGAHIDITIEVSAAVGSSVPIDQGRLEQVLLNLALNARDAMPEGGTLSIDAGPVDLHSDEVPGLAPGKYVRIRVADTGTGMSSETKEHLFEPFFTTKPRGEGTGLGLATVSGIVSGSGGHLSVETGIGVGSTFHVILPVAPREGATISDPAPPHSLSTGVNEAIVLLVEDDTSVREAAAEVLSGAGYRVLQARDGIEGLEVAAQHADQIDLVVTDVLMPKLSGPELVSCLRSAAGRPRVLFMSGYTEDRFSDGLGEDLPLLSKPFNASMLLTTVGAILEDPMPSAGRRPAVDTDRASD